MDANTLNSELRTRLDGLSGAQRLKLLKKLKQRNPAAGGERLCQDAAAVAAGNCSENQSRQPENRATKMRSSGRFEPFPLTEVQQAYWVGRRKGFDLGEIAAHGYMEVECRDINVPRLAWAWNQLIERHDMLRATVGADGLQRVEKTVSYYDIVESDLSECSVQEREDRLMCTRTEMSHQVFETDCWPLFDLRVSKITEASYRFHISVDVLILDAWSLDILSDELGKLYTDTAHVLEPLNYTFREYLSQLAENTEGKVFAQAKEYWQSRLTDFAPAPELPVNVQTQMETPEFIRRTGKLDCATWKSMQSYCKEFGVTPSVVLLTAYALVLANWSSNRKFTLNLTVFNREDVHPQVNSLVGDFTSVILLEVDLVKKQSFIDRVRQVQRQLWNDMDHVAYSGIQVMRDLASGPAGLSSAKMPVVFTSAIAHTEGQIPFTWMGDESYTVTQTPQVWLDNQIAVDRGQLIFDWDSLDALFPEFMLDDMFAAYEELLKSLSTEHSFWQESTIELTPASQRLLVDQTNSTFQSIPSGLLHTPFTEQVKATPEAIAVVNQGRRLSYQEIDNLSNQVANNLVSHQVACNELVAVVMDKSWEQVVAVLGVLKAGAAYVPVDPQLPEERQWKLFEQSEVRLALTQDNHNNDLNWPEWLHHSSLTSAEIQGQPVTEPDNPAGPLDLAYVIFTSGSTGTPKGVMIDHRGSLNTIVDINQRIGFQPEDAVLAISALNFDLSVYDVFGVLAGGGTVVLPDSQQHLNVRHWIDLIAEHRVSVWNTVPVLFDLLIRNLEIDDAECVRSLRQVMLSGDWIPVDLPRAAWSALGRNPGDGFDFLSLGGATEASIWSITYPVESVSEDQLSIPYGKAMVNQTMQVLHPDGTRSPVYVPGEIHIGGIGLAQGYWRDPIKTNASFVIHEASGDRLYRTGDLGRLLPDGNIEFLGRKDFQVKIQGHRIELGEIESALLQHAEIDTALVATTTDHQNNKNLVAYVVPRGRKPDTTTSGSAVDDQGVLQDDTERMQFRYRRHGIRKDISDPQRDRLPGIELTESSQQRYASSRSYRNFTSEVMEPGLLGEVLSCLRAIEHRGTASYLYSSAGGLYPVQAYVYVKPNRISGIAAGVYYYHPLDHQLYLINSEARIEAEHHDAYNRPAFEQSAFSVFLIAKTDAIKPMYGHHSTGFCTLEAGLMCQLMENTAVSANVGFCQVGAFNFTAVRDLFRLDEDHVYLHSLFAGVIPAVEPRTLQETAEVAQTLDQRLKDYLGNLLPAYMVPNYIVEIDAMPLSANGKIDRKSLPEVDTDTLVRKSEYAAPASELEVTITEFWKEALNVEKVGIDDSFFDLGGNSVQMVQINNRLNALLGTDMNVVEMFFNYPNIRALARQLGGDGDDSDGATATGKSAAEKRKQARRSRKPGKRSRVPA